MLTLADVKDDPVKFGKMCWPHVDLYKQQQEILYSLRDNDETIVPAGNDLGKDFVAAFAVLWFFCTRRPVMVVTTSVSQRQLDIVLWGEIRRFIRTSKVRLPLHYNYRLIRHVMPDGTYEDQSALTGEQCAQGEGLLGRHIPRGPNRFPHTLAVFDEASAIADSTYESTDTWAHRKLIISNCNPCSNFFYRGVKAGDLKAPGNGRLYRKVIRIRAPQSPHVRHAELAIKEYKEGRMNRRDMLKAVSAVLIPGVLDYEEYKKRRLLWDKVRQCIGLDAEFYEGAEVLMFPPDWLNRAEEIAAKLEGKQRKAEAIGVDSAQGGDNTAWVAVDKLGMIAMESMKTPDTSVIPGRTITFMQKWGVKADRVMFDAGGGGKQHVDILRRQGYNVKAIAFGATAMTVDRFKRHKTRKERGEDVEIRAVYKNRRSEMYGILMELLDPIRKKEGEGFGLPTEIVNAPRSDGGASLREQLAPIPKDYGAEGVLELRPKNKRNAEDTRPTLTELIGCSPDEADALVLATFGLVRKTTGKMIRAF